MTDTTQSSANASTNVPTALTDDESQRLESIAKEIEQLQNTATFNIAEHLAEAHGLFRYRRDEGGFGGWVESRLTISRQTAYNLLNVHERFGRECVKYLDTFSRSALILLAAPSTPDEVRSEFINRAQSGESILVADVKRAIASAKTPGADEDSKTAGDTEAKPPQQLEDKPSSPPQQQTAKPRGGRPSRSRTSSTRPSPSRSPSLKTQATPALSSLSWTHADPAVREQFVTAVGIKDLFEACPPDEREAFTAQHASDGNAEIKAGNSKDGERAVAHTQSAVSEELAELGRMKLALESEVEDLKAAMNAANCPTQEAIRRQLLSIAEVSLNIDNLRKLDDDLQRIIKKRGKTKDGTAPAGDGNPDLRRPLPEAP
jgi:hypothetical protein